jgi:hypothetical protein
MNKYQLGKRRWYKGWVIQEVFQEGEAGLKRVCWKAEKKGTWFFEDTLAKLKQRIREEEYQYDEEEP